MDHWFAEAPTHHLALSVGHNSGLFIKIAKLMNIPYAVLFKSTFAHLCLSIQCLSKEEEK